MRPVLQWLLGLATAAVLLLVGFAGLLAGFGAIALWSRDSGSADHAQVMRIALQGAFLVVALKALLPQLVLASLVHTPLARLAGDRRWPEPVAWLASAMLAYAVVGPLLLTREVAGLPAMEHAGAVQHVGTLVSTSLGVAAAAWAAEWLVAGWVVGRAGDTAPGQIG